MRMDEHSNPCNDSETDRLQREDLSHSFNWRKRCATIYFTSKLRKFLKRLNDLTNRFMLT